MIPSATNKRKDIETTEEIRAQEDKKPRITPGLEVLLDDGILAMFANFESSRESLDRDFSHLNSKKDEPVKFEDVKDSRFILQNFLPNRMSTLETGNPDCNNNNTETFENIKYLLADRTPDFVSVESDGPIEAKKHEELRVDYEKLASRIPITVLKNLRSSIQSVVAAIKYGILHCVIENQKASIFSYFNPITGELVFIPTGSWTEKGDGQINVPFEFYSEKEVRFKRSDLIKNLWTLEKNLEKKMKYEKAMSLTALKCLFTLEALFSGGKRHHFSEESSKHGKKYEGSFIEKELQDLLNDPTCKEFIQKWEEVNSSIPSNASFLLGVLYAPNDLDRPWDNREPNKVKTGEILVVKRSELRAGKNAERFAIAEVINPASTGPNSVQINVGGGVKDLNKQSLAQAVTRIW